MRGRRAVGSAQAGGEGRGRRRAPPGPPPQGQAGSCRSEGSTGSPARCHRPCQQPDWKRFGDCRSCPPCIDGRSSPWPIFICTMQWKGLDLEIEAESNRWQARAFYNSKRLVY